MELSTATPFQKNKENFFSALILVGVFLCSASLYGLVELFRNRLYFVANASTYLVFHNVVEFFSIIVSFSIFLLGISTYKQARDDGLFFLSCTFFGVGLLDFIHVLSFPGEPAFITANSTNKGILFWISARLLFAIAFLVSIFVSRIAKKFRYWKHAFVAVVLMFVVSVFYVAMFHESALPAMFTPGSGLTPLKIYLEYAVAGLLAVSYIAYINIYFKERDNVYLWYLAALTISIFSELAFTLYKSAYDTFNMLGHIYKFMAFCAVYAGIFIAAIRRPYIKLSKVAREMGESQEKFFAAFNSSPDLMAITRVSDGKILEINKGYSQMLGYSRDESVGKTTAELSIWADAGDRAKFVAALRKDDQVLNFETSLRRKDGTTVAVIDSARTFDLRGEACILSTAHDITDRKKMEEKLRENAEELRKAQRLGRIGNWDWDVATDIITWSEEYYRIFGFDPTQPPPKYEEHLKVYTAESASRLDAAVKKNTQTGEPYELDLEIAEPKGLTRWITARSETKRDANGKIIGLRGTAQDITNRKMNEERLKELDKLKDDFLMVTTHELKSPLLPIKAQAQMLLAEDYGKLNIKQKEALEMVYRNEEAVAALADEVLDISKIKSNKLKLSLENVSVGEIIAEAVADTKNAAEQKHLSFTLLQIPKIPKIMVDRSRVKQVIINLFNNSIKFTPENGTISVEVAMINDEVVVRVKDSGIGIREADIARLFTPFFRAESDITRKYRGTGLGLAISKGFIEAHGGKIWAESEGEGKGSTFIFTLPA